jgi:hypothetical protein
MDASDPNGDWTMRDLFEAELAPGEKILWTGRPSLQRKLDGGTIFGIAGALVWLPVLNWFMVERIRMFDGMSPFGTVIWFVFMAIIFLTWTIGYPARRLWYQRHTGYALTDQRILELVTDAKGAKKRFRSDAIELVEGDRIRLHSHGIATIEFSREGALGQKFRIRMPVPELIDDRRLPYLRFVEIEDGQALHRQFLAARDRIRGAGVPPG